MYLVTKLLPNNEVLVQKFLHIQTDMPGKLQPKEYRIHVSQLTLFKDSDQKKVIVQPDFSREKKTKVLKTEHSIHPKLFTFSSSDESEDEIVHSSVEQSSLQLTEPLEIKEKNLGARPKVYSRPLTYPRIPSFSKIHIKDTTIIDCPRPEKRQLFPDDYEEVFEDNSILSPEGEGPNMEWDTSFDLDISKYETPDQQTSDFHFRQLSENPDTPTTSDNFNIAFSSRNLNLHLESSEVEPGRVYDLSKNLPIPLNLDLETLDVEPGRVYNLRKRLPVSSTPKKTEKSSLSPKKVEKKVKKKAAKLSNLQKKAQKIVKKITPNSSKNSQGKDNSSK